MKHFENILVVVKEDNISMQNPALYRALELAERGETRLTLMTVVQEPTNAISHFKDMFKPQELTDMLVGRLEDALKEFVEKLNTQLKISTKVVIGRQFIEIVRQVIRQDHDLLIKMADGTGESFNSEDFHLMRKCPAPVWLHRPGEKGKTRKVLAAVDLDHEEDKEGQYLNETIIDFASSIAYWEEAELHLLSCWSFFGEKTLRNSGFIRFSEKELANLLEHEKQHYTQAQKKLIARYDNLEFQSHLIKGEADEQMPDFVNKHNFDTVVMGTVARTGIPGLLIGNTAETILHKLNCSVLTLKPKGFESIVK